MYVFWAEGRGQKRGAKQGQHSVCGEHGAVRGSLLIAVSNRGMHAACSKGQLYTHRGTTAIHTNTIELAAIMQDVAPRHPSLSFSLFPLPTAFSTTITSCAPVLSEQMTVKLPSVSMQGSWRTMAF